MPDRAVHRALSVLQRSVDGVQLVYLPLELNVHLSADPLHLVEVPQRPSHRLLRVLLRIVDRTDQPIRVLALRLGRALLEDDLLREFLVLGGF